MPLHSVIVHTNGPAIWPEMRTAVDLERTRATTVEAIWEATYQGRASLPSGSIFRREWFTGEGLRYRIADPAVRNRVTARWLSFDTAESEAITAAYTAGVVLELWPDYRVGLREVTQERVEFPALLEFITALASRYGGDGRLRGVLVEEKSSGTQALQTLRKSAAPWLRDLLIGVRPIGDKVTRASQAAVWCKNGSVILPHPDPDLYWLPDFEDQLFNFPSWPYADMVDAFGQGILYLENLLQAGYEARGGGG